MRKLRKGDQVIVIAGKDKGKVADIEQVVNDGAKLIVSGVNIAKKHVKPNPQKGEQGGVVDKTMPINASNVAIYNADTKKADRVGFKIEDGKKSRIFKSNSHQID